MKFRKKPVIIEAEQFIPFESDSGHPLSNVVGVFLDLESPTNWSINTLEGKHQVTERDWIITGIKGEKYPCKPDIFEKTYEKVRE